MSLHHPNINCNNNDLLLVLEAAFITLMPSAHLMVGKTIFQYKELIETHLKNLNENCKSNELKWHISACQFWLNIFNSFVFI